VILLERAQFERQYPEIAAATFLAQEKQPDQLVIYMGSSSRSHDSAQEDILDLQELCEFYQQNQQHEIPNQVSVIAERDISMRHTMTQAASPKKVSFWALGGVTVRLFCTQTKFSADTQIYCYGAAHSSIQIDMLVRDHDHAHNSHSRIALNLFPEGSGAQMRVRGAYLLKDAQSVRVSVLQKHVVPNSTTDVVIKGIVQDKAQAYYEGLIFIDKRAVNTRAVQENKNMILGAHAIADSRPTLEVLNHEVSCAHGSAVGQLDPDQLFYLVSRGLDPERAQGLLLDGFMGDLFDQTALSVLGEIKVGEIKS
jgi:Fe-S cluster assembly scaffold protein SufB